jgi:hypothetical protein
MATCRTTPAFLKTPSPPTIALVGFCSRASLLDLVCGVLYHLVLPVVLLPLDTTILASFYIGAHLPLFRRKKAKLQRQVNLRDAHFDQKTVLITGLRTPRGLTLARQFHDAGHRVIGADVGHFPVRSSGSMSNALHHFYQISKLHYVATLLDIINREKVEIWIPCSNVTSALEDSMAKETIESRTACKCVHFDADLGAHFSQRELFLRYVLDKGLPIAEQHHVCSRDSVHKILHRSPLKRFLMRKLRPAADGKANESLLLPKRTLSQTYSDVSEVRICDDEPWVLEQQGRVGEYWSDLLLIHGQLKAFRVHPIQTTSLGWNGSRLDEGLYMAMCALMEKFAERGGLRLTGHLSVKLLVDEEFSAHSVRYVIYIADCVQGTAAVHSLLKDPPEEFYQGYLAVLSPEINGSCHASVQVPTLTSTVDMEWLPTGPPRYFTVLDFLNFFLVNQRQRRYASRVADLATTQPAHLCLWSDPWFSRLDPLPWWWQAHVYGPLNDLMRSLDWKMETTIKMIA